MKTLLLLITLAISQTSYASTYIPPPPFESELRRAKNVFIFRLLSTELLASDSEVHRTGKIEIIENIRGNPKLRRILFHVGFQFGGIHLDVGNYYLAFVDEKGDKFTGNYGNVVELRSRNFPKVIEKIEALLTTPIPSCIDKCADFDVWFNSVEVMPPPPPKTTDGCP